MNIKINKLRLFLLDLPRDIKLIISLFVDSILCIFTVWISFYLRLGEFINLQNAIIIPSLLSIIFAIPVFYFSGLYRTIFRYSGWPAMLTVSKSIIIYGFLFSICITLISFKDVPRTIGIIQPLLLFFTVGGSRALIRYWIGNLYRIRIKKSNLPKAAIYGAGNAGRELILALENNDQFVVSCFLDDDQNKHGRVLAGKKIYSPEKLEYLVKKKNISSLLLALPRINSSERIKIIKKVSHFNLSVRTLPNIVEIAKGNISSTNLMELEIDELLGREKVDPDKFLLQKNIKNKVVMVTGAGGSIGSQLCREILSINPKKMLILDSNEFSLYKILSELNLLNKNKSIQIIPLLCSIQDEKNINSIFETWRPNTVYHAAAYKHVPIVEYNLAEGLKNNVFGTLIIAKASLKTKVKNFVFISTDKAVRPTNVMGASKRLGELCLQALFANQDIKETKFSMVRFGNVLDSSGSVIPKFRKQIQERMAITLTHPDIRRFFMTIEEAAELVIQAGAMSEGGDVFLLDMGEPVKIYDLALKMIQYSGLKLKDKNNLNGDIEIKITGLRPGEKLFEELLIEDNSLPTKHPKIFKAQDSFFPWDQLTNEIDNLEKFIYKNDVKNIISILRKLVIGYTPPEEIVDWIFNENVKKNTKDI
ncbi:polysaccharide biosynthesis protein [Prochlorococcus sp. AH-736-L19]|nr:nucleoside-diphosphate sugar epimerase/dehydratase [Prochlorococcus sp. AH-736-L19]MDA9704186.1 polysaccharide biosynthesis protein [Prochlorococcus sp. AH-736-L19]